MSERDDLERRLAALPGDAWDPEAPPPLDLPRALAAREDADDRAPERRRRWPRAVVLRPGVALACAALLLVLGGGAGALLVGDGDGDATPSGRAVDLAALGPAPRGAHATATIAGGTVTLDVRGLRRSGAEDYYEVWALRTPTRLVSLGSFRVGADGHAHLSMPLTVALRRFPVLDVSIEPADGDPAHSTVSVLRSRPVRS